VTRFVTRGRYAAPVAGAQPAPHRRRGSIDRLPSGALRVRIYAGIDPVTKHRHYLTEIIPASAKAHEQAEVARTRLLNEINERRHPRTSATVGQLLDRYLEVFDGDRGTLQKYRGYLRKHIMPFIGQVKVGTLDADILDSLYAELRRCRTHCDGRGGIDHRTPRAHTCDERCHAHKCRPLAARTVRHMHFILSGAYKRAVRWRWVAVSPVSQAEPPSAPAADPQPHHPQRPRASLTPPG
jgi:integrase